MSKHKPILQTRALSIGYHERVVAEHLTLSLQRGELVCLLGPNGAGKSTLMRTLAGMQKPLGGQVLLAEQDVHHLKGRDLAQRLSIVLTERPNVGLLNGYALVALGRHPYTDWTGKLSRYDEAVVRWAVDAVNAGDIAGQPINEMSDGQRQKFMIARALAQESDLILLDEPTAYLDLPRRVEIMQLLRHLAHETGRAILLSTHDLDLALRSADSLWLMSEGVIQSGTPEDLVLNGAFESAFAGDGIQFDRRTGSFTVHRPAQNPIAVQGEGIAYIWTCRALERAGFTVVEQADLAVRVSGEDNPHWCIENKRYGSIRDLLSALGDS